MLSYSLVSRARQRAFTLIEMLVVLVIIGLLVTLIMQGFGYSLGIYQRVTNTQKNAYSEVLAYNWLRATLGSQAAARPKATGLEATATQLTTYSFQPLLAAQGLKTRIGWQLLDDNGDLLLRYSEGNQAFTVYRWPAASGRMEFLDSETGEWQAAWPPQKSDPPPLPAAVKIIVFSGDHEARNYVVAVETRKRAEVTLDEVLYGRE